MDAAELRYFVYQADSADKVTGEAMEKLAIPLNIGGSIDCDSFLVTGLLPETEYWFGVLVCDQAGNKTYYDPFNVCTDLARPKDIVPPTLVNDTLTADNISTRSFTLIWDKATDDVTSNKRLKYTVYIGETETQVVDIESMETDAKPVNSSPLYDVDQLIVTGLSKNSTYYFNVVVCDEAGNKTAFKPIKITTTSIPIQPDMAAPTILDDTIRTSKQHETGVTLSWKKATDNAYEDNELVYYVYRCKEDGNEDDVRGMEALSDPTRAILQNPGGSKDIDTLDISGLTPGKLYWYNIVVEDPAGNKTSYSMASAYAREPVKYKVEVIISGGGSVSPASCEVNEGEDVLFEFTPQEGYQIKKILIDGRAVPFVNNEYTLENVRSNRTLEIFFEKISTDPPILEVTLDVDGVKSIIQVEYGNKIARPATPTKDGFIFIGWYTEDDQVYDFDTSVITDFTLHAKWKVDSGNSGESGGDSGSSSGDSDVSNGSGSSSDASSNDSGNPNSETTSVAGAPKTGDNSPILMLVVVLCLSVVGMVVLIIYRNRKNDY